MQQQQLCGKYPDLPKSYLADLAFTQQALEPANTTLPALDQEIERAREQIRIARVFEGLYPDWPRPQQSDGLAFSLLETLAPWPQDLRLEFIDAEADPSGVLQSIGVDSSLNYRRLKKNALHYEVQDPGQDPLDPCRLLQRRLANTAHPDAKTTGPVARHQPGGG